MQQNATVPTWAAILAFHFLTLQVYCALVTKQADLSLLYVGWIVKQIVNELHHQKFDRCQLQHGLVKQTVNDYKLCFEKLVGSSNHGTGTKIPELGMSTLN